MKLDIDSASSTPIYQQIIDQFHRAIVSDLLKHDEKLPSVRDVAQRLRVNPNTVARAYYEMERDGIVYTRRGQGTFVSALGNKSKTREKKRLLTEVIDQVVQTARSLNMDKKQIRRLFDDVLTGYDENGSKGR